MCVKGPWQPGFGETDVSIWRKHSVSPSASRRKAYNCRSFNNTKFSCLGI